MNRDIVEEKRWRSGVLLVDRLFSATAVVKADEKAKRIYVWVDGKQRRDYFAVLREALMTIHGSFEKLGVVELVPLPDRPDVEIEYLELIGYQRGGREEIFVGRWGKAYNVQTLLDGLVEESRRKDDAATTIINVRGDYFWDTAVGGAESVMVGRQASQIGGSARMKYHAACWGKGVVYGAGLLFIGLVGFLAVRNQPIADPNFVVMLRTVLSLVVAVFGAIIPGMLKVDLSAKRLAIRGTGALALFVLTFLLSPNVIPQGAQ